MAVSYEFGALAYQQTKEYESADWTEYVDYTDLELDYQLDGNKFITIFANNDDYLVKIIDRNSFEVYQLDEDTGEILIEIDDVDNLYNNIAENLADYWYDAQSDNDDY